MADKENPADHPGIIVTSYKQEGGITAGVVNIEGVVPARAEFSVPTREQTPDGYVIRTEMTLLAQYVIPCLQISASSNTLRDMKVRRAGGGASFNVRMYGGAKAIKWQSDNVGGRYVIEMITERDETVNVEVRQL